MTLREQVEALPVDPQPRWHDDYEIGRNDAISEVLDLIDAHRCIDPERLARALLRANDFDDEVIDANPEWLGEEDEWWMTPRELAARVVAALEEQDDG